MKKYFYLYVLPLIWLLTSIVSYYHHGNEYALYFFSCYAGFWIYYIFQAPDTNSFLFPALVSLTGTIVMIIPALLLFKLKTRKLLWAALFALCAIGIFLFSITRYPSIEKALSKNGSWWAYIAASINIGLYLSIILSITIAGIKKLYNQFAGKEK